MPCVLTRLLTLPLLAGTLLSSACTGDDGRGSNYGGFVAVHPDSGRASAEFYSAYHGQTPSDVEGECFDLRYLLVNPTYEDVGPSVTLTGGANPMTLDRVIDGEEIHYESESPDVELDTDYEVAIGTDVLGIVSTPAVLLRDAWYFAGTLTWSAAGADEVVIVVATGDFSSVQVCVTSDTGSFTIPADVLAAVPSGFIQIKIGHVNEVDRNGRSVRFFSSAGPDSIAF